MTVYVVGSEAITHSGGAVRARDTGSPEQRERLASSSPVVTGQCALPEVPELWLRQTHRSAPRVAYFASGERSGSKRPDRAQRLSRGAHHHAGDVGPRLAAGLDFGPEGGLDITEAGVPANSGDCHGGGRDDLLYETGKVTRLYVGRQERA